MLLNIFLGFWLLLITFFNRFYKISNLFLTHFHLNYFATLIFCGIIWDNDWTEFGVPYEAVLGICLIGDMVLCQEISLIWHNLMNSLYFFVWEWLMMMKIVIVLVGYYYLWHLTGVLHFTTTLYFGFPFKNSFLEFTVLFFDFKVGTCKLLSGLIYRLLNFWFALELRHGLFLKVRVVLFKLIMIFTVPYLFVNKWHLFEALKSRILLNLLLLNPHIGCIKLVRRLIQHTLVFESELWLLAIL